MSNSKIDTAFGLITLVALTFFQYAAASLGYDHWLLHLSASLALAVCLLWTILRGGTLKDGVLQRGLLTGSRLRYFLTLVVVSFAVYFRREVFYHWDDYDVLAHFAKTGLPGVVYTHNEHFMPLFFLLYYAEIKLFGISYGGLVAVSTLIHAITAFVIYRFMHLLMRESENADYPARVLALLWMLSGVHIEVLNWPFTQQGMTSEILVILGMCAAVKFLRGGSLKFFAAVPAIAVAAPLCFGNGLRLPLALSAVVLFELLEWRRQKSLKTESTAGSFIPIEFASLIKRSFAVLLLCAVTSAGMYLVYKNQANAASLATGTGVPISQLLADSGKSLGYIFVGTQLGTVLRGLSLCPSLHLEVAMDNAPKWLSDIATPEGGFAIFGAILSLFLLYQLSKRGFARYWVLGQLIMITSFALPSMARWKIGMFQSLAMRYQYHAMLGLAVLLLPLFIALFQKNELERPEPEEHNLGAKGSASRSRWGVRVLACWIFAFLVTQLYLSSNFDYFTSRGRQNRLYITKLREYKEGQAIIAAAPKDKEGKPLIDIKPLRTKLPKRPDGLSPWMGPEEVYPVLNYLDPKRFPNYG